MCGQIVTARFVHYNRKSSHRRRAVATKATTTPQNIDELTFEHNVGSEQSPDSAGSPTFPLRPVSEQNLWAANKEDGRDDVALRGNGPEHIGGQPPAHFLEVRSGDKTSASDSSNSSPELSCYNSFTSSATTSPAPTTYAAWPESDPSPRCIASSMSRHHLPSSSPCQSLFLLSSPCSFFPPNEIGFYGQGAHIRCFTKLLSHPLACTHALIRIIPTFITVLQRTHHSL
jgi:hypothetical protein